MRRDENKMRVIGILGTKRKIVIEMRITLEIIEMIEIRRTTLPVRLRFSAFNDA